jgi:hypothetical protein
MEAGPLASSVGGACPDIAEGSTVTAPAELSSQDVLEITLNLQTDVDATSRQSYPYDLSGIAMLSEEALKCYYSRAFRWKIALLAAAVCFYFTLHRRALLHTDRGTPTLWSRAAGHHLSNRLAWRWSGGPGYWSNLESSSSVGSVLLC